MPFQVSPGVNWTEYNLQTIVPGISTSTGAYVGDFAWGPVDEIMTISSENELLRRVSKPNNQNYVDWYSAASFLAYSDHLKLVRVIDENATNAASGGDGVGLTLDVNATSGVVTSISVASGGTGYKEGDLVRLESSVTPAIARVTAVSDGGIVAAIELKVGGEGHNDDVGVDTVSVNDIVVRNSNDLLNDIVLPELIAKYPGSIGNTLIFSAVRASEFDNWTFKNRFVVAPAASTVSWDADGNDTSFTLPDSYNETLPSDAIITRSGIPVKPGSNPGEYSFVGGAINFNVETETFAGDNATNEYNLTNTHDLDTLNPKVSIDGTDLVQYNGVGLVPYNQFKAFVDRVEIGVNRKEYSGNGNTLIFTVFGTDISDDAKVLVNGVEKTVVAVAPSVGEVQVEFDSTNSIVTFAAGEAPAVGSRNVEILWDFPDTAASIVIEYGHPESGSAVVKLFHDQNEIHAVTVDNDGSFSGEEYSILERYEFLSLTKGARFANGTNKYYVDAINKTSPYVVLGTEITIWEDKKLTGGSDATTVSDADRQIGFGLFRNSEKVDVDHIIGGAASNVLAQWLISNIGEFRRDCVVYLSPPFATAVNNTDNEARDIVAHKNKLPSSSYATMDSSWKLILDVYNDVFRWVPIAGDHAGMYALTHETVDPWFSGAGPNRGKIRNSIELSFIPDQTDRDILYKNGVNPVANFTDTGAIMYGDKTMLGEPSPFDRMNVRWLFIVLEVAIARAARFYLFEFNDEFTRNQFINTVHPFLRDVQGRRGITDFRVVADDNNNPGSVVDRNEFVGDIYIKPARSINFIQLNFNAVGTDVSFEEIIVNRS